MQLRSPSENPTPPPRDSAALSGRQMSALLGFGAVVFGIAAWFLSGTSSDLLPPSSAPPPRAPATPGVRAASPRDLHDATNEYQRGEKLAHVVCISCHLFPEPNLLDRVTWGLQVLPSMETWLGMNEPDFSANPGGERLKASRIYPESPVVSAEEWRAICTYYLEAAPARFQPTTQRPKLEVDLKLFRAVPTEYRVPDPSTTLVKIDERQHQIYVGDAKTKTLSILTAQGTKQSTLNVSSAPVSVLPRPDGLYVTLIGSVSPSELTEGTVLQWHPQTASAQPAELLTDLARPTDLVVADLNGDGREDLLITQYGNVLGHFSWFENKGHGKYQEHILIKRPGAIKAYIHDFNGDGRPDIIIQMAQAREGIYLLYNEGGGVFRETTLLEFPPSWGSSYFELADFNGDGFPDLLVTNGDNGDLTAMPAPFKDYHGVRIYLNDGHNQFKESWFYGMHGAYKAMARDFDNDGDLDIAAISFFPDYLHSPRESFIYFENVGAKANPKFNPSSVPESFSGRWMTMDVGDLDGDGKIDIVLGAFNKGPGFVPSALAEGWKTMGPSVLLLKNVGAK